MLPTRESAQIRGIDIKELISLIEGAGTGGLKQGTLENGEVWNAVKKPEIDAVLRSLIVKHPTEWQVTDFSDKYKKLANGTTLATAEELDNLKRMIGTFSFAEDVPALADTTKEWYYFQPIMFAENLIKMGTKNPYSGKTSIEVVDNPGFAPYIGGDTGFEGYAKPSGLFNEDYMHIHAGEINGETGQAYKTYFHEGVDFPGIRDREWVHKKTPIHSFISGTVLDLGTHTGVHSSGMGDYMIIQDNLNLNLYYLLVHLDWESWKQYGISIGSKISPGMPVADVGHPDAFPNGWHLHVSVIVLNEGIEFKDDLNPDQGIINAQKKFPIWLSKNNKKMRNPFKHSESWLGRT